MTACQRFSVWFLQLAFGLIAAAAEWPKDYVVQESSNSPDGKYAIAVRSRNSILEGEGEDRNRVYLADVPGHRVLGEIRDIDYFQGQNHCDLKMHWTPDSKWCAVEYDGRFGFDSIVILELENEHFDQTEIGDHIHKSINQSVAKQSHDSDATADVTPYFRTNRDRELEVRALATTNPKELEGTKSYYARFAGFYDLSSKTWKTGDAFAINSETFETLGTAYQDDFDKHTIVAADQNAVPDGFTGAVFSSEEERAGDLERTLNDVYKAVRLTLPPKQFASVKQDQIEWLKKRERLSSIAQKSDFTSSRIHQLQDSLW